MKNLLIAAVTALSLLFPFSAAVSADELQASDSVGTTVTLRLEPCEDRGVLERIASLSEERVKAGLEPFDVAEFMSGSIMAKGENHLACWITGGDQVLILAAKIGLVVPAAAFQIKRSI